MTRRQWILMPKNEQELNQFASRSIFIIFPVTRQEKHTMKPMVLEEVALFILSPYA